MNYSDVRKEARVNLNNSCKVCNVCNGVVCAGEVPGMGGKGTGTLELLKDISLICA